MYLGTAEGRSKNGGGGGGGVFEKLGRSVRGWVSL